RLAGFAHPVALDRLREDHGRLALRLGRRLYAAKILFGSWPPRFRFHTSSSVQSATSAFSSGVLKKCSRTNAPDSDLYVWYSPSTTSIMRRISAPVLSRANNASQRLPQTTLMTF